jgi:hypothetical protein
LSNLRTIDLKFGLTIYADESAPDRARAVRAAAYKLADLNVKLVVAQAVADFAYLAVIIKINRKRSSSAALAQRYVAATKENQGG